MGISIFGNDWLNGRALVQADIDALVSAVKQKSLVSVFFVGGFAAKYGYD